MATNTYVALETQTLTSTAASVTFSSISQAYTDLVLVAQNRMNGSQANLLIRVGNGSIDTGSNYSETYLSGNGTSASSGRDSNATYIFFTNASYPQTTDSSKNFSIHNFQNYSNTTTNKTVLSRSSNAAIGTDAVVGLWRSTSAINTIRIFPSNNSFEIGSTFTLYGIASSNIGAPKAFGGTITQDATYTYHTFGASGTFTANQSLTCDLLLVGGGGGGGGSDSSGRTAGGGGGAGGYLEQTGRSVSAGSYSVTIGAGGAQGTSAAAQTPSLVTRGVNGNNSIFDTVTAIGGGGGSGGGAGINGTASTGGSGGGGNAAGSTTEAGAAATQGNSGGATGYGFAGGSGSTLGSYQAGAGGGGAGGVGANSNAAATVGGGVAGIGGAGKLSTINGVASYYAAGGSGATEGSYLINVSTNSIGGAGGRGALSINPTAGVANTGSGGGGSAYQGTGGNGASGIFIIRYAN
jgi:hypothetical protein